MTLPHLILTRSPLHWVFNKGFDPEVGGQLRRAANEAAALAWVTRYPVLFFPVLFKEKAETALLRAERQEQVLQRSRGLLAA